jgi:hypothetical protein
MNTNDRERLVRIVTEEVRKHLAAAGRVVPARGGSSACKVLTESKVRAAMKQGAKEIRVTLKAVITPSARELAEANGIKLIAG